jgi:hypothetical protein
VAGRTGEGKKTITLNLLQVSAGMICVHEYVYEYDSYLSLEIGNGVW